MPPLVSVVTPSFNHAAFVAQTIESVLAQDYPQIEYLVVDGGSTDGTLEILRRYGDRVAWVSERDAGQADALRKGFGRARGEILAWLNADDLYEPGAVSAAVAALDAHPAAGLVYGQATYIDAGGTFIAEGWVEPFNLQRLIDFTDFVVQPAAFFRRSCYDAAGGIDATLHFCMDYDLWIRLACHAPVVYLPRRLALARRYPQAKTFSGGVRRLEEIEAMIRRYGRPRLPASFYPEMVEACVADLQARLRTRQIDGLARTFAHLLRYGALYASWRVRHGRTWPR